MNPFETKLRSAFETFRLEDARLVTEVRILLAGHREVLLRDLSGDGLALARGLADAVDTLLRAWVDACPAGRGMALIALGGYGRGELSPRSDVDLMVLYPDGTEARAAELTGPLLAFLWDLGHVVGHSARSLEACRETMERDLPSATALLEGRLVHGSGALHRRFVTEVVSPWLAANTESFVTKKIEEARARHRFYGGSPLLLTPNVKESAGGLRDMHVAGWIGIARSGRKDFGVFRDAGLLDDQGSRDLIRSYSDVHRVRHVLHLISSRRHDVLDPALRDEVARRLGFTDLDGFSAAERFMRHYYRGALTLARFLDRVIRYRFECPVEETRQPLGGGLLAVGREVYPEDGAAVETPARALAAVLTTYSRGLEPSPDLEEAVKRAAAGIDDRVRSDPAVAGAFLDLLRHERAGAAMRLLDRAGFLGEYLPEYGRLAGLAREDPHHQFTVDEHTLRAVDAFGAFAGVDHPRREEFLRLPRPDLVRLGLLLHDVGKARAGDHVERGTAMVPDVTARVGLSDEDADLVRFLVGEHLLLTGLADRRVPVEAAGALARAVPDRARLRALFLATLADVAAVGRGALSGWREAQIDRLYRDALAMLSPRRPAPYLDRLVAEVGKEREGEVFLHLAGMGSRYALEVNPARAALHLDLIRKLRFAPAALLHLPSESFGEVWTAARDGPGLFARLAGILTLNDLDIQAAHAYTREDGVAIDGFTVTADDGAPPVADEFWSGVARDLVAGLTGELDLDAALARHRARYRPDAAPRGPMRPVGASWSNRVSDRFTTVEVTARDRRGLLHDLARRFSAHGLSIHNAIVATRGEEVTDTFYVTGPGGRRPEEVRLAPLIRALDELLEAEGETL